MVHMSLFRLQSLLTSSPLEPKNMIVSTQDLLFLTNISGDWLKIYYHLLIISTLLLTTATEL